MIESVGFIQWCVDNLNYGTITLLMTIESSFIPFPSEIVVPPAGYLAATEHSLNLWLVILFATLGADLGAVINYYLARLLGRPLVYRFVKSRIGKMLLLSPEKLDKADSYFIQKGAVSTFVGRLLPGIRQLISIPAGLAGMPLGKFLFYTTIGAGIWNTILAFLGYWVSRIPGVETKEQAIATVTTYSKEIGYSLLALVLIVLVILWIKKRRSQARKTQS